MSAKDPVNVFKYTDYGDPILYEKSDYRTATARAHRFTLSAEKKFVPRGSHTLCRELNSGWSDYRPKSESSKQFTWKINSQRNHHEALAPSLSSVGYNHSFTDKVKASGVVIPLNYYRSRFTDVPPFISVPHKPSVTALKQPKIEYICRETHTTDTEGYFPMVDTLVSTTSLDFKPHPNYATAKTNLILKKKLPFNSDVAFFVPESKLIKEYPLRNQYSNENMRDVALFIPPSYDRIVSNRSNFVSNFGLTSEMSSSY